MGEMRGIHRDYEYSVGKERNDREMTRIQKSLFKSFQEVVAKKRKEKSRSTVRAGLTVLPAYTSNI